jgi:hypothetical protein
MFVEDYSLDPTTAKIKFKSKFPIIDLTGADVNSYIRNKYKEVSKINQDKITNIEKIFKLYDSNGNIISKVISFKNNNDKTDNNKFVIIANDNIFDNLSDNMIGQYFMDCTYKTPYLPKFKLTVISGYHNQQKKSVLCSFVLIHKENEITFNAYLHI